MLKNKIIFLPFLLIFISLFAKLVFAIPPASFYTPGETLNPNCSPGDANCDVESPLTFTNISDDAYDEATWNGVTTVAPSKNAIRDKLESLGGGVTPALSNLAAVAINTSLISDTDLADDLGSAVLRWNNLFVNTIGATGARVDKGWFTDLEVTNAIVGSITGNAATVTTNANLTGPITSVGNTTSVASQTGTGSTFVMNTSPTLVTPNLGTPSALVLTNATGLPASSVLAGTFGTGAYVMDTSLSVPSLITASGALGITPAAGSNLNVNLSTTGDFAVNTNQLYVDTSAGNVGIGSTSPSAKLSITGAGVGTGASLRISDSSNLTTLSILDNAAFSLGKNTSANASNSFVLGSGFSGGADGSLDTSFDSSSGAGNSVYAVRVQSDGKIIIGGAFTDYGGTTRQRVARLNSDGSLDTSFDSSSGAGGNVSAAAVQSDGKIIIGGGFTDYGGTTRQYVARLNTDGSLDTSFDSSSGANSSLTSVAVQSDGKILIGGYFTEYGGTARKGIARLNTDGSLDTSFDPGTGVSSYVDSITIQPDGKIIVTGFFSSYNGVTRQSIARVNSDGSLDTSFDSSSGANEEVFSSAIQSDGKIVIGGVFSSYGGTTRQKVARLNTDGSLDTSFDSSSGASNGVSVAGVAIGTDGKIIIVGDFTLYAGVTKQNIAIINTDGSPDTSFDSSSATTSGMSSVAVQTDGKIVIGGYFTTYDGVTRQRVARLDYASSPVSLANSSEDSLLVGFNGSTALFANSSSVGVGTITPSFKLGVAGSIGPETDAIYNLGSASKKFATLYANNAVFSDLTASRLVVTNASKGLASTISSTDLRSSISGTTGTGSAVFATSPVLTTPRAAVVYGGTAVGSTLTLRSTTANGTTDAIIFGVGNNGATEAMRIINGGNVGIGVTGPTAALHLKAGTATASTAPLKFTSGTLLTTPEAGAIEFLTDAFYGTITTGGARKTFAFLESPVFDTQITTPLIIGGTGTTSTLTFRSTSGVGATGADIVFQTGNNGATEAMRILNSGTVSIGSLETGALNFDTDAGVVSWVDMEVTSAASVGTPQSYTAQIDSNPVLTIYGLSDGAGGVDTLRVGIGQTTPTSRLDVTTAGLGVTQTTSSGLALVNTTAAAAGAQQISPALRWSGFGWKTDATAASQAVDFRSFVVPVEGAANPTGYLTFQSSVNGGAYGDRMIITTAGLVGIGVTPTYALDVLATGTGVIARFNSANSTGCTLADGGTITCTSDERMKKDIEDITYGLETVMNLRPVLFNWQYENSGTDKSLGFIAQEVESLLPKLVVTDPDGMKSLNTTAMIPVLTRAVQELNLKISDINELENFLKPNTWRDKLIAWLGNVGNGITKIFVKEISTDKLCVKKSDGGDVCLTGDQLDALLLGSGSGGGAPSPSPESSPEPEEPIEEEIIEEMAEEESTPEELPAEEPVVEDTSTPPQGTPEEGNDSETPPAEGSDQE